MTSALRQIPFLDPTSALQTAWTLWKCKVGGETPGR
jgi:hypothetical protein